MHYWSQTLQTISLCIIECRPTVALWKLRCIVFVMYNNSRSVFRGEPQQKPIQPHSSPSKANRFTALSSLIEFRHGLLLSYYPDFLQWSLLERSRIWGIFSCGECFIIYVKCNCFDVIGMITLKKCTGMETVGVFKAQVNQQIHMNKNMCELQNELDMCLWNTDAPGGNKVQLWQKSKSPTFWPCPTPQGRVMSVKCEQPLDELTVQVW